MRAFVFAVSAAMLFYAAQAFSQVQNPGPKDTFAAAKLTVEEVQEIIAAVEQSAYDTPDSWQSELRTKRIAIGRDPGLIVRGTKLLCGATDNCQTWIFRKASGKWLSLFGSDQAPIAENFQLGPEISNGVK